MVSVDKVYKTVLDILNKESGGGYVTASEFNRLACKAQTEIIESYYIDIRNQNAASRNVSREDFSETIEHLREKLSIFRKSETVNITTDNANFQMPSDFYRLNKVFLPNYTKEIEEVQMSKLPSLLGSPLTCPSVRRPAYVKVEDSTNEFALSVYPKADFTTTGTGDTAVTTLTSGLASIVIDYTRKPADPNWIGDTTLGEPIPNTAATGYQDFELHESEFPNLVGRILTDTTVLARNLGVTNFAIQDEANIKQEQQ